MFSHWSSPQLLRFCFFLFCTFMFLQVFVSVFISVYSALFQSFSGFLASLFFRTLRFPVLLPTFFRIILFFFFLSCCGCYFSFSSFSWFSASCGFVCSLQSFSAFASCGVSGCFILFCCGSFYSFLPFPWRRFLRFLFCPSLHFLLFLLSGLSQDSSFFIALFPRAAGSVFVSSYLCFFEVFVALAAVPPLLLYLAIFRCLYCFLLSLPHSELRFPL